MDATIWRQHAWVHMSNKWCLITATSDRGVGPPITTSRPRWSWGATTLSGEFVDLTPIKHVKAKAVFRQASMAPSHLNGGIPPLLHGKNHHLRFMEQGPCKSLSSGGTGPSHPSFPGLRGLAEQCSILLRLCVSSLTPALLLRAGVTLLLVSLLGSDTTASLSRHKRRHAA